MRSSPWRLAAMGFVVACSCQVAAGQSNQEWIALKRKCGIPGNTAYNDWVAAGSKCNSGSATPGTGSGSAEQLGTTLGNIAGDKIVEGFHNLLRGTNARPSAPLDPALQQRALAAQQLNNSGIYLLNRRPRDFAAAINEFQKALQQAPDDAVIAENLRYAKRLQKESAAAGQTSNMLGNLLGNTATPSNPIPDSYAGLAPNVFNPVNLDPNVVDFRGMFRGSLPEAGRSYLPAANANALNTILAGANAGTVDLSGTTKTAVDPKLLRTQIDGLFGKPVPAREPPAPVVVPPEAREIDKLFLQPQGPTGTQGSLTEPQPSGPKKQSKAQADDPSAKPAPPPHN